MGKTTTPLLKRKPAGPTKTRPVVQPKLAVGPVNDRFEREANQIADRVVNDRSTAAPNPLPVISGIGAQRTAAPPAVGPEQKEEELAPPEERAQRSHRGGGPEAPKKAEPDLEEIEDPKSAEKLIQTAPQSGVEIPGAAGGVATDEVEASIQRMRRRPAPGLDPATREKMEEGTGLDFGEARVHTDRPAGEAADALGAKAFTVGQDMFFAQGQFNPKTTAGQHLIAHELTHTMQQSGGSATAQRIQRAGDAESESTVAVEEDEPLQKTKKLGNENWEIDLEKSRIKVPDLELPQTAGALKGAAGGEASPASNTGNLPVGGQSYERPPVSKRSTREGEAASQKWVNYVRDTYSSDIKQKLDAQLKAQGDAATVSDGADQEFYVLKRGRVKATTSEFIISGTIEELSKHDSVVRPMLKKNGTYEKVDADHILEDQIDGKDSAENLWLLDRSYNRSIGPQIDSRINKSLIKTVEKGKKEEEKKKKEGIELEGKIPEDSQIFRRNWTIVFHKVKAGKFSGTPKNYWTKADIQKGEHLPHYKALTNAELFELGFKFDPSKKVKPKRINVYPARDGGRPIPFKVSSDGKSLKKPGFFFTGIHVLEIVDFVMPAGDNQGGVISTLKIRYSKRKNPKKKGSELVSAEGNITVQHDPRLGFGGFVTRESVRAAFKDASFGPLSPLTFPDVHITGDGVLTATGQILSSKALFPDLQIPIELRGTEILISFPIPTDKLDFGPVKVTEAALEMGAGDQGFFIQGMAALAVDSVGSGILTAKAHRNDVILKGDFDLELDFLDRAKVKMAYSLQKDDFKAELKAGFKKKSLPGVESGEATVTITRESIGVVGTLNLGGILAGSVVTIGYTPEMGLVVEGKDLPLPVDKLPGVSNAKVTVKAVRNPETGLWLISGGGQASLGVGGASGTLDILFDGEAVTFKGRADVAKGPAKGWLDVTATNRAVDEEGNPIENGPVGDLKIWGKGEASITFGEVLTGTAGLEYTPDGRVIISGEIALPPTFDLFEKVEYNKTLLEVNPPDFPIWGVKLGPVGIGIFAFVDAEIRFMAYVGPGQLRDTKVKATLDLDKPEEAVVEGTALFFVPSYAGLTLDVGGGLKAQVANAYVKGRVGLDGTLGLAVDISLAVNLNWNQNDGLAMGAEADISGRPKFEVGVNASVTAGVDLWLTEIEKTWGPWRKKLGEFGPDMELGATMPMAWSEKEGLNMSLDDITIKKPKFDAKAIMKDAFDTLV